MAVLVKIRLENASTPDNIRSTKQIMVARKKYKNIRQAMRLTADVVRPDASPALLRGFGKPPALMGPKNRIKVRMAARPPVHCKFDLKKIAAGEAASRLSMLSAAVVVKADTASKTAWR